MDNPFEHFAQELNEIKALIINLEQSLPKNNPIKRYSVQEIAENTPLGEQTIRSYIKKGVIEAERVGNKYLIKPEEFDRVCEEARSLKYKRD